jgi:hypothetical protein
MVTGRNIREEKMRTTHITAEAIELAQAQARGVYQQNLIQGYQLISGSDIAGKWTAGYHRSRLALLRRLEESGLVSAIQTVPSSNKPRTHQLFIAESDEALSALLIEKGAKQ